MIVQRFVDDKESTDVLSVGADMRKINYCFRLLKELYVNTCAQLLKIESSKTTTSSGGGGPSGATNNVTIVDASHYDSKELKDLKETLRQRDNEISESIKHKQNKIERNQHETDSIRVLFTTCFCLITFVLLICL